jgi:hypothetical protein
MHVLQRDALASVHLNLLYRRSDGRITAQPLHARRVVDTAAFPSLAGAWIAAGSSFFADGRLTQVTAFSGSPPTADFLLYEQGNKLTNNNNARLSVLTATWNADLLTHGVVSATITPITPRPGAADQLLADPLPADLQLAQHCERDAEDAMAVSTASRRR